MGQSISESDLNQRNPGPESWLHFCIPAISMQIHTISLLILILTINGGCKMKTQYNNNGNSDTMVMSATMTISSTGFQNESSIPRRFSCQGDNSSPALSWTDVPHGTKTFALVCEDPDAPNGTFIHWVIWNIPSTENGLAESIPQHDSLPNGARQGINGAKKVGYMGPCPPPGNAHRYYFRLFALDKKLDLSGEVTRDKLMSAIHGHVLGEGEIMGTYQRQ
jgi:Raf kinase inhibitor-like YbhB/YbcL family protein